jgi:hypothetical protein
MRRKTRSAGHLRPGARERISRIEALCRDTAATRDDLREAVETFEDAGQIARRVLGDAHPLTEWIEDGLQDAQDALYARGLP